MINLKSIKTQLIIFLSAFALYLAFKYRDGLFVFSASLAVLCAVITESAILYLKNRKFSITESSVISGLIIGFLLSAGTPLWMIILASVLAIGAKYLIVFKGKHLFNPAALGVFLVTLLFSATTQWQGAYSWRILIPFGIYFAYRMRKTEVLLGYLLLSFFLFSLQLATQGLPLTNIFRFLNYFYIFIMVIEPKTTPTSALGKFIFGSAVAVLAFIFNNVGIRFDAELAGLLIMNMAVPILNKVQKGRLI